MTKVLSRLLHLRGNGHDSVTSFLVSSQRVAAVTLSAEIESSKKVSKETSSLK